MISSDVYDIALTNTSAVADKNLYAYSDNNPVMRVDPNGNTWQNFSQYLYETVNEFAPFFAGIAGISQLDSPAIGPCDVAALIAAGALGVGCVANSADKMATDIVAAAEKVKPIDYKKCCN